MKKYIEKISISADEFGYKNPQQIHHLVALGRSIPEADVFRSLFAFFYDPALQTNGKVRQELAGKLLLDLNPKCPLDLEQIVQSIPRVWNVTVEELPWYVCNAFGAGQVELFLQAVIETSENIHFRGAYETFLFWVQAYEKSTV